MSNVENGLSRPWDAYDAYLFDIDGTLLHCTDAVHYFAFCETLSRIAGRSVNLDGVAAHGNTDVGILRDALRLAGMADEDWRPSIPDAREAIAAFVEARKADICADALPGVREMLAHLRAKNAILGVATGNLERVGRIKLEQCGLLECFDFGGFSDACEYRHDVFAGAVAQARALMPEPGAIVVVGDTPADVNAAHENGLEVIAVSTGIFTAQQLLASKPEVCVPTLQCLLERAGGQDL